MEQYFYLDGNNQQQGPVDGNLLLTYGVTQETLVWKQGMENWQPAGSIAELAPLFTTTSSTPPTYTPPTPAPAPAPAPTPGPSVAPGSAGSYARYRERPDNYLVFAILATVLCCVPAGIVAIVKASKVNGLWEMQKFDEAYVASEDAKKWCIISLVLGFVAGIFMFIIQLSDVL